MRGHLNGRNGSPATAELRASALVSAGPYAVALGRLAAAELAVPPGFVVRADALSAGSDALPGRLRGELAERLAAVEAHHDRHLGDRLQLLLRTPDHERGGVRRWISTADELAAVLREQRGRTSASIVVLGVPTDGDARPQRRTVTTRDPVTGGPELTWDAPADPDPSLPPTVSDRSVVAVLESAGAVAEVAIRDSCRIELAVTADRSWITGVLPVDPWPGAALRIAVDLVDGGLIDPPAAIRRIVPAAFHPRLAMRQPARVDASLVARVLSWCQERSCLPLLADADASWTVLGDAPPVRFPRADGPTVVRVTSSRAALLQTIEAARDHGHDQLYLAVTEPVRELHDPRPLQGPWAGVLAASGDPVGALLAAQLSR